MPSNKNSRTITSEFLDSIAAAADLPNDTWYFILAVTLSSLNRPEEIGSVLRYAIKSKPNPEQVRIARRIREALVKSAPVVGLPKTINALLGLKSETPTALLEVPRTGFHSASKRTADFVDLPAADVLKRGKAFFDVVYGSKSDKLLKVMASSGTPDLEASGQLMYAYFLSNTNILSGKETMFVTMSGMIVTDVQSTLLNHMRGAVNHGATVNEVNAVRKWVFMTCENAGMIELKGGSADGRFGWINEVAKL